MEDDCRGGTSPNDDVLINVEAFRGAIRKGQWKLVKIALLPGKTELFDLSSDPGETTNVADKTRISFAIWKRACWPTQRSRSPAYGSRRNRLSWASRVRPSWTRTSTLTTAGCRMRRRNCQIGDG